MPEVRKFAQWYGKFQKPTKNHRPAVWENMLGTVYAMDDNGEILYCDYDWDKAGEWAGLEGEGRDPRIWRNQDGSDEWGIKRYITSRIRTGKMVLWVLKKEGAER